MSIAQNKYNTFLFAINNNIATPQTEFPKSSNELMELPISIKYPFLLKRTNFNEGGVVYCNNKLEYQQIITKYFIKQYSTTITPPIIQEYIQGKAFGFYALFNHGTCLAYFMHERIHEYPITGGSSTLAKSFYDRELYEAGILILEKLKWHGPAMVEFKKDIRDNQYKLIEINPKLWGSLELSTYSGINFPYLIYLLALNKPFKTTSYNNDIYFRWTIPHDLLWLHFADKEKRKEFVSIKQGVKINDNIHFDDPLIIIFNIMLYFYMLIRDKKYPHGIIKK